MPIITWNVICYPLPHTGILVLIDRLFWSYKGRLSIQTNALKPKYPISSYPCIPV